MGPLLQVAGLRKSFGATRALDDLTIDCAAGSVHAVIGENGAGKSTLMKIISGVLAPDAGTIKLGGSALSLRRPLDALQSGISTIYQEFVLLPNLSVTENLFLGAESQRPGLSAKAKKAAAQSLFADFGYELDPDMPVGKMSVGEQQMAEIAKGLHSDARLFIFDEPTAALAGSEARCLFDIIRRLKEAGKAIFYVSHRLPEIFALADTISVLKDGRLVDTVVADATDEGSVIEMMVGRPLTELFPPRRAAADEVLLAAQPAAGQSLPLTVNRGEIVGLAGLEGHGQTELLEALMGFRYGLATSVALSGADVASLSVRDRIKAGLGFVPENRKDDGLLPSLPVAANMRTALAAKRHLLAPVQAHRRKLEQLLDALAIKTASLQQNVMALSGGNQQKVLLGRWLAADVQMLLCAEPTRGVDVGAKRDIYALLARFAGEGRAVLMSSRDLIELLGLCHRICVMRNGRIVADLDAQQASESSIMRAAVGADGSV